MMITVGLVLLFVSVECLVWAILPDDSKRLIRQRVFTEVGSGKRLSVLDRITMALTPVNRWLPTGWYGAYVRKQVEAAGARIGPMHFLVLQEMGALTGLLVYGVTIGGDHLNAGWLALFVLLGALVPYLWLKNTIADRRMTISRDLPEIVDLISLCVDAGIDFMNALGRILKEFRACPTTEELGTVLQEVRIGKRRRDALRAFSARVQTAETSSFSRTLIQADRMGTGISEALRVLSEDMRMQRYHWADRFAQQAPLKMLIPLLFSLASALIIVAGPILGQFLQGGFAAPKFDLNQQVDE